MNSSTLAPRDAATWLVAHRGFPHAFPENSLAGVRAALEAGALFVEFDIQLSRDGVPIAVHDPTLARVGNSCDDGDDEVGALDWKTLSKCTIGEPRRFGDEFIDQRVPSLAQMLALIDRYPGVTPFVELKRESLQRFGTAAVVEPVLAEMRRASSRCVPISFDAAALEMIRAGGADGIGLVTTRWDASARREAKRLAPQYVFIQADSVATDRKAFQPCAWQWAIYVVDEPTVANSLRKRGADLIETDRFPWMVSALRRTEADSEDRA